MRHLLAIDDVSAFCDAHVVDVTWTSPERNVVTLHGGFDGTHDYFSIVGHGVSYVDLACSMTVARIALLALGDVGRVSKYSKVCENYIGQALVMWETEGPLEACQPEDVYLIIADSFVCMAGKDWSAPPRRDGDTGTKSP